jgi:hypothetical protein
MNIPNTQHKIKSKIVAFMFNTRADVLREEMYRALCLHVMGEIVTPCNIDEIISAVAYSIGPNVEMTSGLRTIIVDVLNGLVTKKEIEKTTDGYYLATHEKVAVPNSFEEEELKRTILKEINRISIELKPNITMPEVNILFDFYLQVCNLVAKEQMAFLTQSGKLDDSSQYILENISEIINQAIQEYKIEEVINCNDFIYFCFIDPSEVLSNYVYTLIQVNIIMQLLSWDPALEYLKDNVLKGKTIYLDSNILFALMLKSHSLNIFLENLLITSIKDLGVKIKVHERTIEEYKQVMHYLNIEFSEQHSYLRQLAKIIKNDGDNPKNYLGHDIFVDYLTFYPAHIDLGSWQRYTNDIGENSLVDKLKELGISIDKQNAFVPVKEFEFIKDNMHRASKDQVSRGKRGNLKQDVTHDVQIYYLIKNSRHRLNGELSFGYDTYLLTLDGSLTFFSKYEGITWTETYFMFPTQWYELAFPFLRMKIKENPAVAKTYTSLAFSSVFPSLEKLIPLHIFGYVFDNGGTDISLTSVKQVIESLTEQRLLERLDPSNKNIMEREAAKLQIQRIIAEKTLEERKTIDLLKRKEIQLKKQKAELETDISQKKVQLDTLEEKTIFKEAEVNNFDKQLQTKKNVTDIYKTSDELRSELETKYSEKIEASRKQNEEEIRSLQNKLTEFKNMTDRLNKSVESHEQEIKRITIEKETELSKRIKQLQNIKKIVVTGLMLFGILLSIGYLYQIGTTWIWIIIILLLMILGLVFYHWPSNPVLTFIAYSLGLFLTTALLFTEDNTQLFLWIIPMSWELVVFGIDRLLGKLS